MIYNTQINLLASVYGSGDYNNSTYNGATTANTGSNTTGTGATSTTTNSGGTTSGGILTNTGFDVVLILTLAVVIMFVAMIVRYWNKLSKKTLQN